MVRRLRVMADYGCDPLWDVGETGPGNLSPERLPVSSDVIRALRKWAAEYDANLNREDPAASGFADDAARKSFAARGLVLAQRLADELGPVAEITYFDECTGDTITIPTRKG